MVRVRLGPVPAKPNPLVRPQFAAATAYSTAAGIVRSRFARVAPTFAQIAESDYILLTTFTKDGRPKPTPIWAAADGERLLVITQEKSWKVRRIRNTPRVTLAICDVRGRPKSDPIEATATVLDKSYNGAVYHAIGRRYGLPGRLFSVFSKLRGGMEHNVGLQLTAAGP